jgi:ABC-2 type transport system ATP-binding protein
MIAQIDKVSKFYAKEEGLKSASFTLDKGQVVGLFGLNGSGKTTTIKLLAGLLRPDSGVIRIDGGSVRRHRQSVAYLTDRSAFYPWMSIKDVRRMMSSLFQNFDENLFQKLVSELDVPEKPLGQMSKGQSQRLRLVATMARKARLYLLDEPLSGIDLVSRELIIKTLIKHWDKQSCILLSTHEIREVETFFDRGLFLKDGALVSDVMADDLYRENKSFTDFFIKLHHSGAI